MAAQKKTFEALYGELEDTTRKLEQGNLPLEESLKLYEKGAGLVEELRKILDEAELHVKTLQVRLQPPGRVAESRVEYDAVEPGGDDFDDGFGEDDDPEGELIEAKKLIELDEDGELVETDAEIDFYEYEDDPTDD
jgi:exodeoxyribonuclease VII small subunit